MRQKISDESDFFDEENLDEEIDALGLDEIE